MRLPGNVQGKAYGFHQMGHHDFGNVARLVRVDRCAAHRISARGIAAVGPVQHAVFEIELEIDRFGKLLEKNFDVRSIAAVWPLGISMFRAIQTTGAAFGGAFLRPIEFSIFLDRR